MDTLRLDLAHRLRLVRLELSLEIGSETVALVGPSGGGKTSVLRAVAGLLRPDAGTVALGDETWLDTARGLDLPPERRSVGYVFQDYALFPHLDVARNVAFGGADGTARLLERFRLSHLAGARPGELSGGEQQRVALARALARQPRVLLLDEPLSALDAHTRDDVRAQLQELLREARLPTLLVTHDFEDAAALADRVGVLVDGRLLQLGTPQELVDAPAGPFVASLSGGNLLPGSARPGAGGLTEVALDGGGLVYSTEAGEGRVGVVVQPWDVSVAREQPADSALNHVRAPVASIVPVGNRARVRVGPLTAELTAASVSRLGLRVGEPVVASFKATGTRLVSLG
ncbi:MAG TPA: ABC transporter ATP-binding protein [Gaiellaceae bacterium]|nr:ABC transporter ATP-binding protein [Gaiellaceae bacterium]